MYILRVYGCFHTVIRFSRSLGLCRSTTYSARGSGRSMRDFAMRSTFRSGSADRASAPPTSRFSNAALGVHTVCVSAKAIGDGRRPEVYNAEIPSPQRLDPTRARVEAPETGTIDHRYYRHRNPPFQGFILFLPLLCAHRVGASAKCDVQGSIRRIECVLIYLFLFKNKIIKGSNGISLEPGKDLWIRIHASDGSVLIVKIKKVNFIQGFW